MTDIDDAPRRTHAPYIDKLRDRQRIRRGVETRYGDHAPAALPNSLRPDPLRQMTRKLAVRRLRAAGRAVARWWMRAWRVEMGE